MPEERKKFIEFYNLEVYKLSHDYNRHAWLIYQALNWQIKKIIGDQFIRSVDSIGANIAEGYGRYHYLDKIKFYYNARGSLLESRHWLCLLLERNIITAEQYQCLINIYNQTVIKLNSFIKSTYQTKQESSK